MKAGQLVSGGSALDAFLSQVDCKQEAPSEGVVDHVLLSHSFRHRVKQLRHAGLSLLLYISSWIKLSVYGWISVNSYSSFGWLADQPGDELPVLVELVIQHLIILTIFIFTAAWYATGLSQMNPFVLFILRGCGIVIVTPIVLGCMASCLLHQCMNKARNYQSLIRRCILLSRRSTLISIGAVSSCPMPPFTSTEDNAEMNNSFGSMAALKELRKCICIGLRNISDYIYAGAACNITTNTASTNAITDETNRMFRGGLQSWLKNLLKPLTMTDRQEDKVSDTNLDFLVVIETLSGLLDVVMLIWRLLCLYSILSRCHLALISAVKDVFPVAIEIEEPFAETESSSDITFKDELVRVMMLINRLRMKHEWEATRLWNCECEINDILVNSSSLSELEEEESCEDFKLKLNNIIMFLERRAIPNKSSESFTDLSDHHLEKDLDMSKCASEECIPTSEEWCNILRKLVIAINILSKKNNKLSIIARAIDPAKYSSAADSMEKDERDVGNRIYFEMMRAEKTAFETEKDGFSVSATASGGQLQRGGGNIIDIYSAVVNSSAVEEATKVGHHTNLTNKDEINNVGSLMDELRHHVVARVAAAGLLQRENGGDVVPMSPSLIISASGMDTEDSKQRHDHEKFLNCNISDDVQTINSLASDLTVAFAKRNLKSCVMTFGSSDSSDDEVSPINLPA